MRTSLQHLLWVLLCPLSLLAQKPDSSFGHNGNSVLSSPTSEEIPYIHGGYLQRSGRLLVGLAATEEEGYDQTSEVVAYTPDGRPDAGFGSRHDGTVDLAGYYYGAYLAPQRDEKIIAAGTRILSDEGPTSSAVIERLTKDGKPDSSFGLNGKAILPPVYSFQLVNCVAVDSADYIYVGGEFNTNTPNKYYFTIVRFTPDGRFDSTFRVRHTTSYNEVCASLQVLPDGSLIAGYLNGYHTRAALVKYTHDGRQDSSFGRKGSIPLPTHCEDNNFIDVKPAPNGSIVAATGNGKNIWMFKVTAAGRPDHSFSTNGILNTGEKLNYLSNYIIAVDGQSRILLPLYNYRLKRFAANGTVDSSFGANGSISSTLVDSLGGGDCELALVSGSYIYGIGPYTNYTYSSVVASRYIEGTSSASAVRSAAAALPAIPSAKGIAVYPNPARNILIVSGLSGQTTLVVVNAAGQVLLTAKTGDAAYRLPVSALRTGVYYLRINNGARMIPFVKE